MSQDKERQKMQLSLTRVFRSKTDKQGNPLLTKKDKRPYERVSIKCEEYGDKWLSGFGANWNQDWQEGDKVNVNVEEVNGYLNFSKLDPIDDLTARVERIENHLFGKGQDQDVPSEPQTQDPDLPY